MGNTVSAHIYEIKVFRPYLLISTILRSIDPTLLYCIDSEWTTLSIGGKKLVSLGTTKIVVLDGKAPVLVYMHSKIPI